MIQLSRGQKLFLRDIVPNGPITICIQYLPQDIDIIALSLNGNQKVKDNQYIISSRNLQSPDKKITLQTQTGQALFTIDIDRLPTHIERILFTATCASTPVSNVQNLEILINENIAHYDARSGLTTEKSVIMMELYRHKDSWKLGTISQGFNEGSKDIISHFGGKIEQPSSNVRSLTLNKITLEKKQSICLTKTAATFEEIKVNLNWSRKTSNKGGFFSKLLADKAVDLDLGCLYILKNGQKGVIQALGNSFGSLNKKPYIQLLGDDRTGDVASGETMLINGRFFDEIQRIVIFSYIYAGVPNWNETNGVVTLTTPNQPQLEVHLTEGNNNKKMCSIAFIDNDNGHLKISRFVEYFKDQEDLANNVGIYLKWTFATKD